MKCLLRKRTFIARVSCGIIVFIESTDDDQTAFCSEYFAAAPIDSSVVIDFREITVIIIL